MVRETVGTVYGSLQRSPSLGDGSGFEELGGTGVKNLSLGLRVKTSELSIFWQLPASDGMSKTFSRWPGSKGQTVVDGSDGS